MSGSAFDSTPFPAKLPADFTPAPDVVISNLSSMSNAFGYMTMERRRAEQCEVKVWDRKGQQMNTCTIAGSKSICEVEQVVSSK